ncbi:hypothetical protein RJ640_025614 [Escallonia rubra]|uniref:Pentatricopeptide repeat-containing protein n=1 Tax=Escallonia rubra TaxID=112253 RepID=A0AA88RY20_9ASTE|nr:hypothetical protein RJ640_025614 [Escallonia rubra]
MNGTSQALLKLKHLLSTSAATTATNTADAAQCESLLHRYAAIKSLTNTKKLHAHIVISGLLSSHKSTYLLSLLTSTYAICGHLPYARQLFDELPQRTLRSCKTMIQMYTKNGLSSTALQLFVEMLASGHPVPDKHTYPFVIKACGDLLLLKLGVSLHCLTVTNGFVSDTFVGNSLLAMYMNCGDKDGAERVFNTMSERTVVTWNTMISGYYKNGSANEALLISKKMEEEEGVEADCATVVSVLPACGYLKDLDAGREVHRLIEDKGLGHKLSVRNALLDMYAKCGRMDEARAVFDKMGEKDVVTWTTMINGYILDCDLRSALVLFPLMQLEGVRPNAFTMACLLSACGNMHYLKYGKCLHGWVTRQKLESDVNVETALIDMYANCKSMTLSFRVFRRTSKKRTVPWNAILSGCTTNGLAREAIELYKEMLLEAVDPNDATLNSLLPAYSILADLQQAMNVHSYLVKTGFLSRVEVTTGLLDIYSKSGGLEYAHKIFDGISLKYKDIFVWSVIIAGYGMHGHGETALSLFSQMIQSGVEPNEVTFTSVLHACSHAGLVDEGLSLFKYMLKSRCALAHAEHYTCMVDLLGRADRLEEAYELIEQMPFRPNHAVWGALLGACVIHENVELGEVAARWLFEIEPNNTGNYVLMAKIYAAVGRWKEAENVRHMMNAVGLRKAPAHSSVKIGNMANIG